VISFREKLKLVLFYSMCAAWVVGAFEMVQIAMHSKLPLTLVDALVLSLVVLAWASVLGLCWAGSVGAFFVWRQGFRTDADSMARAVAFSLMGVVLSYLGPPALALFAAGDPVVGGAFLLSSLGVAGIVWLNARFWLRRRLAQFSTRFQWWQACGAAAALVCGISSVAVELRGSGGAEGVPGDHNVLLISVDTLRRDHLSVYAEHDGVPVLAETPRMDALAEQGVLFLDAVTPVPETAPSHGSMFTGLHPLRHGLLSNGHSLFGGFDTLATRLRKEGYATAAFVSSFAVDSRTGLDRGFHLYDDDFSRRFRGISELQVFKVFTRALMKLGRPEKHAWLLERSGQRTNARARDWLADRGEKPWFAWVHYFEPHAPYEGPNAEVDHRELIADPEHVYTEDESRALRRLYAGEVEAVDGIVGEILDALEASGHADNTVVVLVADHGEQLGEHHIDFHHHGLFEESIRVPLILRVPYLNLQGEVSQAVRLMDITPTVLAAVGNEPLERSEGENLLAYVNTPSRPSMSCTLMGRQAPAMGAGALFGLRTQDVKVILDVAADRAFMFNLKTDRLEQDDISEAQVDTILQARAMIDQERAATAQQGPGASASDRERLRALGYVQ
jgi:arylsulfatase A-like enzyme